MKKKNEAGIYRFKKEWLTQYGIFEYEGAVLCLLCNATFREAKDYEIKTHFVLTHQDFYYGLQEYEKERKLIALYRKYLINHSECKEQLDNILYD